MVSGLGGGPVVRQEFGQSGNGMGGDAGEDILEPGEWIDSSPLTGSREAPQHGCRLAALVAAEERPVVSAGCYLAARALGCVVVAFEVFVVARACEPRR